MHYLQSNKTRKEKKVEKALFFNRKIVLLDSWKYCSFELMKILFKFIVLFSNCEAYFESSSSKHIFISFSKQLKIDVFSPLFLHSFQNENEIEIYYLSLRM